MPSHSKKQHNFMEAIAHSPSFAKKAGVPQSVGKDYAAADKGKTFSKGGEMKESKGMVGKEVAFFKKKGAPKSMIKHEEAEMKGMKRGGKVRRMAGGGMGDPFERDTDYDKEKAQGAENLKRIKGFFGFGKKESEPTSSSSSSAAPASMPASMQAAAPAASPNRVVTPTVISSPNPNIAAEMEAREKGGERGSANKGPDYGDDSSSSSQTFKRAPRRMLASTSKPLTVSKSKETTKVTTAPSDGKRTSSVESKKTESEPNFDEASGTQRKYGSSSKIGVASDETREAVRKRLGSALDFFNLSKRHEQEFGKKAAKGGEVKKMAQGGYAKADGIASRGKTQPKMVKMAGGGFVKSADGCAQRGKTKAFQVKMSRGGKC